MALKVARGRIEIHHGPPAFFDDHFEKGWTGSGGSSDGELYTLNDAAVEKSITSFSTTAYPKLYARLPYLTGSGTWDMMLWYDSAWNVVLSSDGYTGFKSATLPSGKIVTKIRITCSAGLTAKFDYISIVKSLVIPLDPPTTQDIWGGVTVVPRLNRNSTVEFVLNNIPSTFKGVGPYTGLVDNKDVVIIWMYRDGDTMTEAHKVFGGIIIKLGDRGEKSTQFLFPIECMDHGWELQKPPAMFDSVYATATNGKTILKAAVDLCTYLSSALLDDASEIASTHTCDYGVEGNEVVPFTILEEFAPKCVASGTGAIGFDWRITPAGVVDLFPRGTISSGITLGDDDLEGFGRDSDWWRCWNEVLIYGQRTKKNPSGGDLWTDPAVNSSVEDNSEENTTSETYVQVGTGNVYTPASSSEKIHLDRVQHYVKRPTGTWVGYYKITYQKEGGAETDIVADIVFVDSDWTVKEHTGLDIWGDIGKTVTVRFYLKTGNSSHAVYSKWRLIEGDVFFADWRPISCEILVTESVTKNVGSYSLKVANTSPQSFAGPALYMSPSLNSNDYNKMCFQAYHEAAFDGDFYINLTDSNGAYVIKSLSVGQAGVWESFELDIGRRSSGWWGNPDTIDWADIIHIHIDLYATTPVAAAWWIDGFYFTGKRFSGSASNGTSQTAWGMLRRPVEVDESLDSDFECEQKADGVLAVVQSPLIEIDGVKLESGQAVGVGETIIINVTSPSISDTVRVMEETLTLIGTDFECALKLSNEPVEIDYVFLKQREALKLASRSGVVK